MTDDPISRQVAGEQGRALAERMDGVTPPLRSLIHARTRHQDQALTEASCEQVLVLGIGLDTRPLRVEVGPDVQWFGVDLPEGIRNRKRRFSTLERPDPTVLIEADLRQAGWFSMLEAAGLDREKSTFVTLEGVSMYLTQADIQAVLDRLGGALCHEQTRVWMDHVTPHLLDSPLVVVQDFLSTMSRMNEPFTTGIDDLDELSECWHVSSFASARDLTEVDDGIHEHYRFGLLGRSRSPVPSWLLGTRSEDVGASGLWLPIHLSGEVYRGYRRCGIGRLPEAVDHQALDADIEGGVVDGRGARGRLVLSLTADAHAARRRRRSSSSRG